MLKVKLQYFGYLMWRTDSWKDPDAGKDWRQEQKGTTEDEMIGWHHQLNGHEFWNLKAQGIGDEHGSLACCSPWGHKESNTAEWLNWTDENFEVVLLPLHYLSYLISAILPSFVLLQSHWLPYHSSNTLGRHLPPGPLHLHFLLPGPFVPRSKAHVLSFFRSSLTGHFSGSLFSGYPV